MTVIKLPNAHAAKIEQPYASLAEYKAAKNKDKRQQWSMFHEAKRRAAKLHRTPKWANLRDIWLIYVDAYGMTRRTGIAHHVDHIYPLQGKLVSGLHVAQNLRAIPATDNLEKHNTFEIL